VITQDAFLVGGRWANPAGPDMFDVVSPTSEGIIGRIPESSKADVDAAVVAARAAFDSGPWPRMSFDERAAQVLKLGEILLAKLDDAVDLQIEEMGAARSFITPNTRGVLAGIPGVVEMARSVLRHELRPGGLGNVLVTREPIGVVAAIMPWNAPIPLLLGKLLPGLLAGCPVIVKPPPESPLSPYVVAEAAIEVGFPEGLISIIPGGREVGEHLISHPLVDRVTFTGSSAAGARVAAICGQGLKAVTLELGGKSAAIVLDDVELDRTLGSLISCSMPNNGQVCWSTTRILAPRARSAELVERMVEAITAMKVGPPQEPDTVFGPLVASRQRDRVEGYIKSGLEEGATIALGGGRPTYLPKGWFVEPTIFTNVRNSMKIAREEIFGPVLSIIEYDSQDEAIAIANDSEYGLGGAVYTGDVARGLEVAARVQTGTININEAPSGGNGQPFGGWKHSGLGRERGREGHESYYELKSISLPVGFEPTI
jgi:aldehyde dehydrogenase (NAD+)